MKTYGSPLTHRTGLVAACLSTLLFLAAAPQVRAQGGLTPPGAPSPMFKTLTQVEPRTDVQRLPGDPTALYIISQPGSYYLTTNIIGMPMLNGISIRADNVTLDLNGFALIGVSNALDAINAPMGLHNLEIRSGNIEGWGGDGVDTSSPVSEGRYVNLRAYGNGGNGFNLGLRSIVTECQAFSNTFNGFQVLSGVIKNCTAVNNGYSFGIPLGLNCFVLMSPSDSDVVQDCIANYNSMDGIQIGFAMPGRATIISGCTAKENLNDGIEVFSGCIVRGNNCIANMASGIHVVMTGTGNRLEENHVASQPTGILCDPPTTSNLIIKNSSQANGVGYSVPPGNHLAAITAFPGIGFVGASPWTNFDY